MATGRVVRCCRLGLLSSGTSNMNAPTNARESVNKYSKIAHNMQRVAIGKMATETVRRSWATRYIYMQLDMRLAKGHRNTIYGGGDEEL